MNRIVVLLMTIGGIAGTVFGYMIPLPAGRAAPTSESFAEVRIAKPTIPPTAIPEIVNESTPSEEIAQVVIVQDTPIPIYSDSVVMSEPEIVYQAPPGVQLDPAPTTDFSAWIIPLSPETLQAAEQPNVSLPFATQEGTTGQTAPIVEYSPMTLDQAWDTVVAMGIDDRFPPCTYPLPLPSMDWDSAIEASLLQTPDRVYTEIRMDAAVVSEIAARGGISFPAFGTVAIPEDQVSPILIPLYQNGSILVCRDPNGKPNLYGLGLQTFFDILASNYLKTDL